MYRVNTLVAGFFFVLLLALVGNTTAFGQSDSLTFASGSAAPGGSVSLNLSLTSPAGSEPASLQWTFSYPASSVSAISVTAGSAATAAGKATSCAGSAGTYTCMLTGMNSSVIQNGVVAVANLTLSTTATSFSVGVTNPQAASLSGYPITTTSTGGTISPPTAVLLSGLSCSPTTLASGAVSTCTATLNQAAPSGGTAVTLANSNSATLSVPTSVTVPAGAATATFSATAATITTPQTANVTATLGTSSFSVSFTLSNLTKISFVQAAANYGSAGPISVSFPSNTVAGDIILVGVIFNTNATLSVTDSQGNAFTQVGTQLISPGSNRSQVYYAKNIKGGPDTVTVTCSVSCYQEVYVTEYSGVDQTNPIDVQAGASGSAGAVSSGNATTTLAGDMIYGFCLGDSACTVGSSFAARSTLNANLVEDMTAGNPGSYAATGSANSGWTMQMVVLKPAGSADTTPPSVPTGITATAVSSAQINLSWTASTDNVGVVGYRVFRNGVQVGSTTALSYTDTGLAAATSYTYTVAAFDAAGNVSAQSTGTTATTFPLNPVLLTGLACSPTTLASGAVSTCTVTLNQASPAGGTAVAISDNSALLTTPASVTVAAGATSATFSAATGTVTTSQSVTITASLNGTSQSTSLTLQPSSTPAGLVSAYSFSEGAGSTVSDSSGNGDTGTINGATWTSAGKYGSALSFNGTSSYVDLGNAASLQLTGSMTASAWVYATANPPDDGQIIAKSDYTNGWQLKTTPDTGVRTFGFAISDGTTHVQRYSKTVLSLNTWYYVTGVYNAAAQTLDIYVNGVLDDGVLSGTVPAAQANAAQNALIGMRSGGFYFNGTIDEVRVYNTALTQAAIQTDMNTPIGSGVSLPVLTSLQCAPTTLGSGAAATCTVTLNQAAPSGGAAVSISDNSTLLTTPASVTVAAGATSATFSATAGTLTSTQSATITATLGTSTVSTTLTLQAPTLVTGLACSPTTLGSGAAATCTVTLNQAAPSGGAAVSISDNSTLLTTPASVTVAAGATSATFSATAGTLTSTQSATITATLGTSTVSATLSLQAPTLVTGLACSPTTLGSGAAASCTVTLNQAAPSGGAAVSISDNSTLLTTPASVTVAAGATSATFSATAGTLTSTQSATITATLGTSTVSATLSLQAPMLVTALACSPTTLGSGAAASCTVTLNQAAPSGGAVVSISDNSTLLTTPASVTVAAGATSATFSATAGTVTVSGTAVLTATLGSSTATSTLNLVIPAVLSSLTCSPTGLTVGASSTCAVTLVSAVPWNVTVALTDSKTTVLSAPASATVAPGSVSSTFTATALASGWSVLSAVLNGATKSVVITAKAAKKAAGTAGYTVSALSCASGRLTGKSTTRCTVALADAAPAGGAMVQLNANNTAVSLPSTLQVAEGSTSADFTVQAQLSDRDQISTIMATAGDQGQTTQVAVDGVKPISLTCTPQTVPAGGTASCEVRLNSAQIGDSIHLNLTSSSQNLRVPTTLTTRPNQSSLRFQASASPTARQESASIQVAFGSNAVQESVALEPSSAPVLRLPGDQLVKAGTPLAFTITAMDARGIPAPVRASDLPANAAFDPATGSFTWTPDNSQSGSYRITFTTTDSLGASSKGQVGIEVDSGKPVVTGIVNGATQASSLVCSPGAVASLNGKWLTAEDSILSDPTGAATELGGTRVEVNGDPVGMLYASQTRVDFLCPNLPISTQLQVSLKTDAGAAAPVSTIMVDTALGIFTWDGSGHGQAAITYADGTNLATVRNYQAPGQPAQAGDHLVIRVTGIPAGDSAVRPLVRIGDTYAVVEFVRPAAGAAGVSEIGIALPTTPQLGDAVPVRIQLPQANGRPAESNEATIAIEAVQE